VLNSCAKVICYSRIAIFSKVSFSIWIENQTAEHFIRVALAVEVQALPFEVQLCLFVIFAFYQFGIDSSALKAFISQVIPAECLRNTYKTKG